MKPKLNMEKIAKGLGAKRGGKVRAAGGFFGAVQAAAELKSRLRVPSRGGRATDPAWTERRLVPLAPETLERLEELVARIHDDQQVSVEPMQLAALLLEKTTKEISEREAEDLVRRKIE